MTYKHLTIDELTMIASYFLQGIKPVEIAKRMNRAIQIIYNVVKQFKLGISVLEYWHAYKENKKKYGRKSIRLSKQEVDYIKEQVKLGWTLDVIIGRQEQAISCCIRTLYRLFSKGIFDVKTLPMKGKRKYNGYQEKRGQQQFKCSIHSRLAKYPDSEFGHLEGNTIVVGHHQSAIITLVARVSKVIITIKSDGRKVANIEDVLNQWFSQKPF